MNIRPPHTMVAFNQLAISRPNNSGALVKAFSLALMKGDRLMLSGPRGCGKSTILRAIGGLWDQYTGRIHVASNAKVLSVPQKPYLPNVSLREILAYPATKIPYTDDEMEKALSAVGLPLLAKSIGNTERTGAWYSNRLSLGEQQALCFARILLAKPDVLMIDEISASLDEKSEKKLYKAMLKNLPNVTLISISHHKSLKKFHTLHGRIKDGALTVSRVRQKKAGKLPSPARRAL